MSVSSMTGFGRGEAHGRGIKVVAELSVVNRKQFDCHVSLPRELASLEARVGAALDQAEVRGGRGERAGESEAWAHQDEEHPPICARINGIGLYGVSPPAAPHCATPALPACR